MRYSIKPIIRDDKPIKKNGKYSIYYIIRFNDIQMKLSSGLDIEKKFWDSKNGRVICKTKEHQSIDDQLQNKVHSFQAFMVERKLLMQKVDRPVVSNFFKGFITEANTEIDFYEYYSKQVTLWVGKKKTGTITNYTETLSVLKQFRPKLNFSDLKFRLIEEFDHYMRTERGNSVGGTFGRHKCLKAIINTAIKNEIIQKNPYKDFPIQNPRRRLVFLELDELKQLEEMNIPKHRTGQNKAKDFFLFSCYTGMRFSDVRGLTYDNLIGDKIVFTMEKTNKTISLPLIKKASKIIETYENHYERQGKLLFPMSNNKRTNLNLRAIFKELKIEKKITFHIARHTFASTHVRLGTHLIILKELLGHSSIEQTEIYAKPNTTQMQSCMDELDRL